MPESARTSGLDPNTSGTTGILGNDKRAKVIKSYFSVRHLPTPQGNHKCVLESPSPKPAGRRSLKKAGKRSWSKGTATIRRRVLMSPLAPRGERSTSPYTPTRPPQKLSGLLRIPAEVEPVITPYNPFSLPIPPAPLAFLPPPTLLYSWQASIISGARYQRVTTYSVNSRQPLSMSRARPKSHT